VVTIQHGKELTHVTIPNEPGKRHITTQPKNRTQGAIQKTINKINKHTTKQMKRKMVHNKAATTNTQNIQKHTITTTQIQINESKQQPQEH